MAAPIPAASPAAVMLQLHRTPGQVARAKQLRWRAERGGCWLAKSRGAEDALVRDQADAQKEEHAGPKEEGARQSLLQVCRGCAL